MAIFFYIFSLVVTTLAVERTMRVFFEKRKTSLLFVVLSYVFLFVSLMMQGWWTVFIYFFALFVVSLNYESKTIKRIASVGGSHYVLLALTAINSAVAYFLPNVWYSENFGLIMLLTSFLVYLMSWLAFLMFKNIKKPVVHLDKFWLPLIVFPGMYTLIELLYFFIDPTAVRIAANIFNFVGMILLIFYLYNVVSKVIEDSIKSALHAREKEYYFTQCQLMQESMEKVKSVRHDMRMHFAALKDHTSGNQEATIYLNRLLGDLGTSEMYSDTGNVAFDSIINFKLSNAESENIALDLSIAVPPNVNVETTDVVAILGNLLDNALEAVAKTAEKKIKLDIEFEKGSLFIKLDNSFDGEVKYLDQQIVSLKKSDRHGYGLKNIKQSVEKYDGYLKMTHDENIFSATVLLYVAS